MSTSASRHRSMRRHSKRSKGLGQVLDDAKDGKLGPIPQKLANALDHNNSHVAGGGDGHGNGNSHGSGGGHPPEGGNNGDKDGDKDGGDKDAGNADDGHSNEGSSTGVTHPANVNGDGRPTPSNDPSPQTPNGGSSTSGGTESNTSSSNGSEPTPGDTPANAESEPGSAASHSVTSTAGPSGSTPLVSATIIVHSTPVGSGVPFSPNSSAKSSSEATLSHHGNRGAIAGGVVGAILFLFLIFGAWIVYKRRRRKNRLPPSAEFLSNPSAYPFARAGFGAATNSSEKTGLFGGNYGGAGKGGAGNAKFKPLSTDSGDGILSEKGPRTDQFRDETFAQPLPPPPPQPEVLYSTPPRITTPPTVPTPGSTPGTPTTPNGRRIPFGTGTFQFPPRPPQPQPQ